MGMRKPRNTRKGDDTMDRLALAWHIQWNLYPPPPDIDAAVDIAERAVRAALAGEEMVENARGRLVEVSVVIEALRLEELVDLAGEEA